MCVCCFSSSWTYNLKAQSVNVSLMCLPTIGLSDTPSDSLKFSLLSQLHSLLLSSSFGSSFKMTSLRSNVISFQCRDCHPTFTAYHPHESHKYLAEQSMWNMYSMIMNMLYTKPSKHISLLHVSCLWCLTDVWEDTSWASLGKKTQILCNTWSWYWYCR